jgi:hypothetical protein
MAITTVDGLIAAMTTARQKFPVNKAVIASQLAGGTSSYWRSAGSPWAAGAIPGAAATCNSGTLGGIPYAAPAAGLSTYVGRWSITSSVAQSTELHDRLAHMGGLVGTSTVAQPVGIDLLAMEGIDNIQQRKGKADYSAVTWWIEPYVVASAATTLTIIYLNQNGESKTITMAFAITPIGRLLQIVPQAGDYIRAIVSVQQAAVTGGGVNYGVTATLERASIVSITASAGYIADWASTALALIFDNSCLMLIANTTTTSAASLGGSLTLIQG